MADHTLHPQRRTSKDGAWVRREKIMESSKVQVIESSFVAPSKAAPTKELWLSPLDHELFNRGHTPVAFFYRSGAAFSDADRIKEGMAMALAAFYPLAGRLCVNGDGRAHISCNGEGALFVVARSDLKSDELDFTKPSPELRGMFVPRVEPSSLTLAVQVHTLTHARWTFIPLFK
ncbi:hypothetical protein HU200_000622 [Digitaria exilis]|uniref:Uncharacterized protein n=1 Tax=Digitaria exilis TaxID=1010633 RepID=A0A835G2E8_9POAL|nr:hypothetical protein HU200_000622 [Digitaria exilis]